MGCTSSQLDADDARRPVMGMVGRLSGFSYMVPGLSILVVNARDGRIVWASRAAYTAFSLSSDVFHPTTWEDLVHPDNHGMLKSALAACSSRKSQASFRGSYQRVCGREGGETGFTIAGFEARGCEGPDMEGNVLITESPGSSVDTLLFKQLSGGYPGGAVNVGELDGFGLSRPAQEDGLDASRLAALAPAAYGGEAMHVRQISNESLKSSVLQSMMTAAESQIHHAMHTVEAAATDVARSLPADSPARESLLEATLASRYADAVSRAVLAGVRLREGELHAEPEPSDIREALGVLVGTLRGSVRGDICVVVSDEVPACPGVDYSLLDLWVRAAVAVPALSAVSNSAPIVVAVSLGSGDVSRAHRVLREVSGATNGRWLFVEVLDGAPKLIRSGAGIEPSLEKLELQLEGRSEAVFLGNRARRSALFAPVLRRVASGLLMGTAGIDEVGELSRTWMCIPFQAPRTSEAPERGPDAEAERDLPPTTKEALQGHRVFFSADGGSNPSNSAGDSTVDPLAASDSTKARGAPLDSSALDDTQGGGGMTPTPVRRKPRPRRRERPDKKRSGLHVLLVDDAEVNQRVGKDLLEKLGHTCVVRGDGDEVEEAFRTTDRPFDVVLLDIVMTRISGEEACVLLRDRLKFSRAIIAVTVRTEPKHIEAYYRMGFDRVLPKPFGTQQLEAAIEDALLRRPDEARQIRRLRPRLPEEGASTSQHDALTPIRSIAGNPSPTPAPQEPVRDEHVRLHDGHKPSAKVYPAD